MKLDAESDRNVLLSIIANATFQGSAAFQVADLITRIKEAAIEVAAVPEGANGDASTGGQPRPTC